LVLLSVWFCAAAIHDGAGSPADFNPASPDGSYQLDLSVAAERAVVLQLLGLDSASPNDLLKGITLDSKVRLWAALRTLISSRHAAGRCCRQRHFETASYFWCV